MDKKQKILVVDDNLISLKHNLMLLEGVDADISAASSGEEALSKIAKSDDFNLILMDVNMPGMSGFEVAKTLKKSDKTRFIPIIFITAFGGDEIKTIEGLETGALDYIPKPVSKEILTNKVKNLLEFQRNRKELEYTKIELSQKITELEIRAKEQKKAEDALRESNSLVRSKLDAILEPQGDLSSLSLSDIIDIDKFKDIMHLFHNITGISSAIIDLQGKVIVGVGWQDICTKFHRCHHETLNNCIESDTVLTKGVAHGEFRTYRCKNNLIDMATPIFLNNKHLGNFFIGQYLYTDELIDKEFFSCQARRYNFDEKEYLKALGRVPRYNKEVADDIMQFFFKFTEMISSLSFSGIKLTRTIAEQKKSEEKISRLLTEKELLLKEVHHRIKNNMSAISGLIMLQAVSINDKSAKAALEDAHSRLQSMSVLYSKLYCSEKLNQISIKDYFDKLVDEILYSLNQANKISIQKYIEDISISANISFSVGIIINELLTNISKYAFKDKESGTITVAASKKENKVIIIVQDDGVGLPDSVKTSGSSKGFGLSLVDMMVKQINGKLDVDNSGGTKFTLEFPITEAVEVPSAKENIDSLSPDKKELLDREIKAKEEQLVLLANQIADHRKKLRALEGFMSLCSNCSNVRDSKGNWHTLEAYIEKQTTVKCSHTICPSCVKKLYPDLKV